MDAHEKYDEGYFPPGYSGKWTGVLHWSRTSRCEKEEINLELKDDGRLTISVEREESLEEEKKNYVHRERRYSSMQRSIYLRDAKTEGVKAQLKDGILRIIVPKEEAQGGTHRIQIS